MFKLFNIIEEVDSPINGKIQIIKDLSGTRIIAGGVSQSGWLVKKVWEKALKKVSSYQLSVINVLILGLGGGSACELVTKYWLDAKIVGVDIDPVMVNMGKKYLHINQMNNLEVVIDDAENWLRSQVANKRQHYDLVLVDLFNGAKIPEKFYGEKFLNNVRKILTPGGVAAFNHLYSFKEKEKAKILQKELRKTFVTVISVLPEANTIFLCFNK